MSTLRVPLSLTIIALLGLAGGCSDPGGGGDGGTERMDGAVPTDGSEGADVPLIPGLMGLRVEPGTITVVEDGVAPFETATYRAIATFEGEGDRDVTAEAAWQLRNPRIGTVADGVVTTAGIGGRTDVVASLGATEATAELRVVLEAVIVTPETPEDAARHFPDDTSGDVDGSTMDLLIVYPSTETMFPRNLHSVNHQWRGDGALDLFEVRFDSDVLHVRMYTAARALEPEAMVWEWLAASHAGGQMEVTVRAVSMAAPGTVYSSNVVTERFSESEVLGALYYWSTGAAGVMRAHISSNHADKFFTDPEADDNTCVSCHTVSRDGRRLAVAYGGERLREVSVPDREPLIPADPSQDGPDYGWGTFNPGATRLLYANDGVLTLLDADTGAVITEAVLPEGTYATHPDWAPDNSHVVVAYHATDAPSNKRATGTSLARIPVTGPDAFGEPEIIVPSAADDDTLYFPSYSPDSRWIAFVRGIGGSKDNETSVLRLVAADGSGELIDMTLLNERVRHEDGIVEIGNSMPTWAPSTSPGIFWLVYSSVRAYGDIIGAGGRDQLWGAAVDPAVATARSGDPSFPGFWMPFQEIDEGNHRAFWTLAEEDVCPSTTEICDGLDNDCNGIVDEGCCTPVDEICDDGIDNDCDGVADEGCGCSGVEICDNGLDDDCDGLTDGADEDCMLF